MIKKLITTIIIILFFYIGCTKRERLNPIDPLNPNTDGKPQNLTVYSDKDTVVLSWTSVQIKEKIGYNIYRRQSGENDYQFIHLTNSEAYQFIDRDVHYDTTYSYRISLKTTSYESPPSDSVVITPGPTNIYITDVYNYQIIKLSHDAIHEIRRYNVDGNPWDIDIDPNAGTIWFSDVLWNAIVYRSQNEWIGITSPTTWWEPIDLTIDYQRKIVWAADQRNKLIRIPMTSPNNLIELSHEQFQKPNSVDVDIHSGTCWLADPGANKVFRINSIGNTITPVPFDFLDPVGLVIYQSESSVYVADRNRIIKISADGSIVVWGGQEFLKIIAIAINQQTGELWISDQNPDTSSAMIIKEDNQGNRLFEIKNFKLPQALAVNTYDGSCFVTDSEKGKIIQISSQGQILSEFGNYYYPRGVAIEYLSRIIY
jgi:hypothetical protein